ncbi:hypothetical protein OUZ56_004167 [Daphnia magna]|uniref:Uncharacterized protein n=1 Tax=Daphnia magna TaxID=35525 RepID=A0ABQ9YNZ4_9CRUS|nr:hypothetical protein OUZ56_004167 [Daphnia magna]
MPVLHKTFDALFLIVVHRSRKSKFPDRDSIKTRISQPPDTGTPTLLQRPVDRPTLFLRLYPRDGADGAAISGVSALIFHAVPLRLVSICRGNNSAAPGGVPVFIG